jgi:membrane fusion protein, multidrug efflux system
MRNESPQLRRSDDATWSAVDGTNEFGADSPNAAKRRPNRRLLFIVAIAALAALWVGGRTWWRGHYTVETDNAYVSGHIHPVSARSAGIVSKVLIEDNREVREGDVLVELDPTDQNLKIEQIEAQIRASRRQLAENDAQAAQARAQRASAVAQVDQAAAQLVRARQDAERLHHLYGSQMKAVSKAEVDGADAAFAIAQADLRAHREGSVSAAKAQMEAARSAREVIKAQIDVLNVQLKDARQQLAYLRVVAPAGGRVGGRSVEVGARVQPGQQLAAIIPENVWITANFKETQLAVLRPGSPAKLRIDAVPGPVLSGKVDSFSPATGSQFSLLPPDNATGNFNKIVQRVPVKIVLDPQGLEQLRGRLAPGMSAVVEVESAP